ncbi:hypothetical protein BACCAP_00121 [Pseudoflavonifractor capillosus ATCC 29799]|uniref:Uncharacterized protein n=1 Tax=Pseudoflavonifractor capillosus ATCC 29799 TaxID=411467 RepID=A6NPK6_9FIRM|nr:hypothetical protein BACCAP_00121 [Pseudoflavonifractor capillosus ATCC 29799]
MPALLFCIHVCPPSFLCYHQVNQISLGELYYPVIRGVNPYSCKILGYISQFFSFSHQFINYSQSLHDLALIIGYDVNGFRKNDLKSSQHNQSLSNTFAEQHTPEKPRPKGRGFSVLLKCSSSRRDRKKKICAKNRGTKTGEHVLEY